MTTNKKSVPQLIADAWAWLESIGVDVSPGAPHYVNIHGCHLSYQGSVPEDGAPDTHGIGLISAWLREHITPNERAAEGFRDGALGSSYDYRRTWSVSCAYNNKTIAGSPFRSFIISNDPTLVAACTLEDAQEIVDAAAAANRHVADLPGIDDAPPASRERGDIDPVAEDEAYSDAADIRPTTGVDAAVDAANEYYLGVVNGVIDIANRPEPGHVRPTTEAS